jgi:MGT family glycosyltransferase
MTSALLLTGPNAGNVYPTLPIVGELTRRGHRVVHLTTSEFAEATAAFGALVLTYESAAASLDPTEVFAFDDPMLPHLLYLKENLRVQKAAEAALDEAPPDLIVYEDGPFIAGKLLARRWNRPVVRITVGFATNEKYSYYDDVAGESGLPGPHTLESFRVAMADVLLTRGVAPDVEEFWYGVADQDEEFWSGMADLNLVLFPRSFQFEGDTFDDRFLFVGPALEGRRDDRWTPPDDRRVLLISLGTSFNNHPEWFRTCVQAFADTRWHVIMTVGSRVDLSELGPLPDNIEAHSWLSHFAVLEHARVCVTHGGPGTVMQSLYWGTPMVVVPDYAFEVKPFARRVVELGLGRRIPDGQFDAATLRDTVEELAGDADTLARVQEMQRDIREAGGAARAADAILAQVDGAADNSPT